MNKELEAFKIIEKEVMYSVKDGRDLVDVGMCFEQLIIVKEGLIRLEVLEKHNEPVKLLKEEGEEEYQWDEWWTPVGKCPLCNQYNKCSAKYCSECGQALEKIEKGEYHE